MIIIYTFLIISSIAQGAENPSEDPVTSSSPCRGTIQNPEPKIQKWTKATGQVIEITLITPVDLGASQKVTLVGLSYSEDGSNSFAILESRDTHAQKIYRLNGEIPGVGTIAEIKERAIVIEKDGQFEFLGLNQLSIPKDAPQLASTGTQRQLSPARNAAAVIGTSKSEKIVVDRRAVSEAMSNLPALLSQARGTVNLDERGNMNGFQMQSVNSGSFYERIGIQGGDLLQRVNGVELNNPGTMLNLFNQLKNENTVKLDLTRNGQRMTLTYNIR